MTRLVEDRELRERFRQGDPAALAEVYREYARPLFSLLAQGFSFESTGKPVWFKGYQDRAEIECAVHEVFTRAFSPAARQAYDGLRPYRNYLFAIARNLVVDSQRARSRAFVPIEELPAETAPSDQGSPGERPDAWIEHTELRRLVEDFLAALEPGERRVFDARFREGLSVEESARRLRISEHRVKKTEKLLRRRFFNRMRSAGYLEGYRYGRAGLERLVMLLVFGIRGVA